MLDLTLFQIEDGLRDLYAMRQELWEETAATVTRADEIDAELRTIDDAIRLYIGAEIKKADGIADFILMLDRLCHEQRERKGSVERCDLDQEIDRLKARRDSLRGVLAHVKDAVKFVMEGMSWREGKPKKLEGVRHSITLRGNGGAQPVIITDEALVPPEYCRAVITMSLNQWRDIVDFCADELETRQASYGTSDEPYTGAASTVVAAISLAKVDREVSKSAVADALNQNCSRCDGNGIVEAWGELDEDADYRPAENPCSACGGSGKAGVPGARLSERGSSIVVK